MWSYYRAWKNDGLTIPAFIYTSKELGADGVELLDFFWKDKDAELQEVDKALSQTGMPVGVYSVANNFVHEDESERSSNVKKITDGVDMAVHFGAKTVRVFAGNPIEGVTFEHALNWIVEGLSEAAKYAETHGITLALENHGKLAGRSDQVLKILELVGNRALKANPDTGNFLLVHQAPHEAVHALASVAAMVHLKDFTEVPDDYTGFAYESLDTIKYKGVVIGEGDVALEDCIHSLKNAGFNGWVNIEFEGEEDVATAIPRSVSVARHLLG
jgi:sugar phosphate isomerase/epimerase